MSRNLFPLSLTATLMAGTASADVPQVAVDIAPVHSLVARVMDGVGEPNLIVQPGASPHEYSLRPSEAQALEDADLVFWIGEDLTPWMASAVETLAGEANVTTLLEAEDITLLDFREGALFEAHSHDDEHGHENEDHAEGESHEHDHEEHAEGEAHNHDHEEHAEDAAHDHDHEEHAEGDAHDHGEHAEGHDQGHEHEEHAEAEAHDHDHDHGHAHGEHDPHAWLSPDNAAIWLNVIAAELSAADPDNAGTYFANAAAAREELDGLVTEINATLEPARGMNFVVFHDAYQYFETVFDFPASGAISIGDATDPSPARIAEIQARVADEGIQCVLSEPQYNPGMVATVMDGTEANTAVLDPLGSDLEPGPELYPQMMRNLATALARCLS